MTDLLEQKQKTLAWVHGEYKFPETPPESLDTREPLRRGVKSHTPETRRKISETRKEWWRNKKRRLLADY